MPPNFEVFTYGSLQIPEVMQAVTGGSYPSRPARLAGFARYCLADLPYPGLCPEPGAITGGVLYSGVDGAALRLLDAFEDDFYRRETLAVTTDSGLAVAAETYVVAPEHYRLLIRRPWDLEQFRVTALGEFLVRCHRLRG
jgi:gamma-glutamylcyclotransferase (GGCT)/AIG2-like uncharacterized protein YtfP